MLPRTQHHQTHSLTCLTHVPAILLSRKHISLLVCEELQPQQSCWEKHRRACPGPAQHRRRPAPQPEPSNNESPRATFRSTLTSPYKLMWCLARKAVYLGVRRLWLLTWKEKWFLYLPSETIQVLVWQSEHPFHTKEGLGQNSAKLSRWTVSDTSFPPLGLWALSPASSGPIAEPRYLPWAFVPGFSDRLIVNWLPLSPSPILSSRY